MEGAGNIMEGTENTREGAGTSRKEQGTPEKKQKTPEKDQSHQGEAGSTREGAEPPGHALEGPGDPRAEATQEGQHCGGAGAHCWGFLETASRGLWGPGVLVGLFACYVLFGLWAVSSGIWQRLPESTAGPAPLHCPGTPRSATTSGARPRVGAVPRAPPEPFGQRSRGHPPQPPAGTRAHGRARLT